MPQRCNYFLSLIALEIVQLGQNISFQLCQISGGVLYLRYNLPLWINVSYLHSAAGCFLCWSSCPLDMISDYGRYFEISLSVGPGRVAKDSSLLAWSMVRLIGQLRI